jgi:hypothetical protein
VEPWLFAYRAVFALLISFAAHDQAVGRGSHRVAVRSQYPLLGVMVLFTVAGLNPAPERRSVISP